MECLNSSATRLTALPSLGTTVCLAAPTVHITVQTPHVTSPQTWTLGATRLPGDCVVTLTGKDRAAPSSLVLAIFVFEKPHCGVTITRIATFAPDKWILVADVKSLFWHVVAAPWYLVAVRTNGIVRFVLPARGAAFYVSGVAVATGMDLVAISTGVLASFVRHVDDVRLQNVDQ